MASPRLTAWVVATAVAAERATAARAKEQRRKPIVQIRGGVVRWGRKEPGEGMHRVVFE